MTLRGLEKPVWVVSLTALASAGVLWGGGGLSQTICGVLLLLILPGFGWVRWVLGRDHGLALFEYVLVSLAASYPVTLVVMLLAHYLPGPLTRPLALAFCAAGIVLPWLLLALSRSIPSPAILPLKTEGQAPDGRGNSPRSIPAVSAVILAIIVAVAGCLMFAHLGTSEFQGDETMALFDAGGALRGDDAALFYHRKGPAEILLPVGTWALAGTLNETQARLPFAWAGLLGVALMYVLGRRAFEPGWGETPTPDPTPSRSGTQGSLSPNHGLSPGRKRGEGGMLARGEIVGLGAAALYALNGYVIGFSRIVQYQSVVMMASTAAVLCFCVFSRDGRARFQVLGAVFLAAGLLAHYDAVFALFPIAYLYWRWLRSGESRFAAQAQTEPGGSIAELPRVKASAGESGRGRGQPWLALAVALAVGLGIIALFYVPFMQPGYFAQTADYIQFRSGGKAFYNNLSLWFAMSTTYNSTYYVLFLLGLLVAAAAGPVRRARGSLQLGLGLVLCGVVMVTIVPDPRIADTYNVAFMPFLALAIIMYVAFRGSPPLQMAWVWFAGPFMVYNFLFVKRPGTHFWTMFAGLALLAAAGLYAIAVVAFRAGHSRERPSNESAGLEAMPAVALLSDLVQPARDAGRPDVSFRRLTVAAVVLVGLALLFGYYLYIAFVRPYPEFRTAYPAVTNSLYWTAYDRLPDRDFFGFAHRAGWKAISSLYAQGVLKGEYDSNEGGEITTWYLPGAPRHACKPRPRYYFLAESVQDPVENLPADLEAGFAQAGLVTVDGRPGIRIYERGASPASVVREYALADYKDNFDRARQPLDRRDYMGQFITRPAAATFGGLADLIGYDLDTARSCPGGESVLTLYWRRAGPPIPRNYKVFVHLEGDRLVSQADDVPGCTAWPTTAWRPGEIIADRHVLELPPDVSADDYALSIGLYDPQDGARLPVSGAAGPSQGDSLKLGTVAVRESCENGP